MRGLILAIALLAGPAMAQTPAELTLARKVADLSSGIGFEKKSLMLAADYARGYIAGAVQAGETINEAALEQAVRQQAAVNARLTREAVAQAYAAVFTHGELNELIDYYTTAPGERRKVPVSLGWKDKAIVAARTAGTRDLGPKLLHDVFAQYCGQTTCGDRARQITLTNRETPRP